MLLSMIKGYVGVIVITWKDFMVQVTLVLKKFDFLHLTMAFHGQKDWFFTLMYASPIEKIGVCFGKT